MNAMSKIYFHISIGRCFYFAREISENIRNTTISTATITEPTGADARIEITIPRAVHITDVTAEQIITPLKLLKSRIADSGGKIISAEVSSEPTRFIANTIITAVITAIKRL